MTVRVDVVDVGHGSCLAISEDDVVLLVDTGGAAHVLDYLEQQEIHAIDTVLISHADEDHVRGLLGILSERIPVRRVLLNADSTKATHTWDSIVVELAELDRAGSATEVRSIRRGEVITERMPSVRATVVAPGLEISLKGPGSRDLSGRSITSNSASAVVRVCVDDTPLLLAPGDLDVVGWDNLRLYDDDLTAQYLVLPHHGGRTATGKLETMRMVSELVEVVEPSEVVASNGRGMYDNPRKFVLEAVLAQSSACRISCTQVANACQSVASPRPVGFDAPDVFSAGAAAGKSCSGTIRLERGRGIGSERESAMHLAFVDSIASTALCRSI